MSVFIESIVEDVALTWLWELGYAIAHNPNIAPCEPSKERDTFGDVVLLRGEFSALPYAGMMGGFE